MLTPLGEPWDLHTLMALGIQYSEPLQASCERTVYIAYHSHSSMEPFDRERWTRANMSRVIPHMKNISPTD